MLGGYWIVITGTKELQYWISDSDKERMYSRMKDQEVFGGSGQVWETCMLKVPSDVDYRFVKVDDDTLGNGAKSLSLSYDQTKEEDMHWSFIRADRDALLKACDEASNYMNWAESGTPWTQQQKDDWRNYRQALLDVPETIQAEIDDEENEEVTSVLDIDLDTYVWPTKPELPQVK